MTIFKYLQNDAILYGFEGIFEVQPISSLSFKIGYNLTRGRQSGNANLPLIPQDKLRSEIKYRFHPIFRNAELVLKLGSDYAFSHKHPSEFESTTPSYFLMHSGIGINLPVSDHVFHFSIQVRNIFNTAYQDHLSVLKELNYYNMGRNVVVSLSIPFHIYQKPFND